VKGGGGGEATRRKHFAKFTDEEEIYIEKVRQDVTQ
jgi:hypothetical protein